MSFKQWLEDKDQLQAMRQRLKAAYPGLELDVWEENGKIELAGIKVPPEQQGTGIGTEVIKSIQDYARTMGFPIVVRPEPEPRKKAKLMNFYRSLGFVPNKGRYKDYTLSSPFALTMYWKP